MKFAVNLLSKTIVAHIKCHYVLYIHFWGSIVLFGHLCTGLFCFCQREKLLRYKICNLDGLVPAGFVGILVKVVLIYSTKCSHLFAGIRLSPGWHVPFCTQCLWVLAASHKVWAKKAPIFSQCCFQRILVGILLTNQRVCRSCTSSIVLTRSIWSTTQMFYLKCSGFVCLPCKISTIFVLDLWNK